MAEQVHHVQLLNNLELSAKKIGEIGGTGTERIIRQADAMYCLYLDYLEAGQEIHDLPIDFYRWAVPLTGMSQGTVWNRLKAGRARAGGSKSNRNQAGLIAEQRERELTPLPDLPDDED